MLNLFRNFNTCLKYDQMGSIRANVNKPSDLVQVYFHAIIIMSALCEPRFSTIIPYAERFSTLPI